MPTSRRGSPNLLPLPDLADEEVEGNRGPRKNAEEHHDPAGAEPPVGPGSSPGKRDDDDHELHAEVGVAQNLSRSGRRHSSSACDGIDLPRAARTATARAALLGTGTAG